MNTQETILQLEGLKLKGMAECYKALQSMPASQWPALDTFIARLAEAERQYRNRKRTEMYLKTSKLRYNAVMEDVICSEREIVPGMCHRKTGLLHGTQGGILLHEQVHRAYSPRQT